MTDKAKEEAQEEIAKYFQGVCLLCCTDGDSKERILTDLEIAKEHDFLITYDGMVYEF